MENIKCKICGEKAIDGQTLCWDCWVKSKSEREKPIFDNVNNDGVDMLKTIFGIK